MKAITYTEYGPPDVLRLSEIERPVPKDDEVLIRIHAASVNALDCHFMRGEPRLMRMSTGLRKPKMNGIGVDVAGTVEAVGKSVTLFEPGNEVFGVCRGAFAEYACTSELRLATKPPNVSFEQAAAVPIAAVTALQAIRDRAKLEEGQRILINGAGGGVGTFAVQIAKLFGAEVTAVTSTTKMELMRTIGADHVIDYTREDFTRNGQRYDVILELGLTHPLSDLRRVMTRKGTWLLVGGLGRDRLLKSVGIVFRGFAQSPFMSQRVVLVPARMTRDDLRVLREFLESGKITPVIDRTYQLSDVAKAIRQVETGRAGGKVVITIRPPAFP